MYALQNEILSVFDLDHIDCQIAQSNRRTTCFMMSGNLELFCSVQCRTYHNIKVMFKKFKAFNALGSELSIIEFFNPMAGLMSYDANNKTIINPQTLCIKNPLIHVNNLI